MLILPISAQIELLDAEYHKELELNNPDFDKLSALNAALAKLKNIKPIITCNLYS